MHWFNYLHSMSSIPLFLPPVLVLRSCQECLSEVYMPVLTSVFEAPPTSPLYEIDAANMADFVIQLTRPTQPDVSFNYMSYL